MAETLMMLIKLLLRKLQNNNLLNFILLEVVLF